MAVEPLLRWLVDGSIAASVAVLLVLALRRPLRRAFGAGLAYAVWALVPLSMLAASFPRPASLHVLSPELLALRPGLLVLAASDAMPAAGSGAASDWRVALVCAWLCGAALAASVFVRRQQRYMAALGLLKRAGDGIWRGEGVSTPAVVGALRPRIVLPADLGARHAADEVALVIAHERAHVARGDTRANLLAVALRCLQWFNPLLHFAADRFRLDQELACDAAVLARHPHARRRYADAMLNVQLAVPGLPVGCHWQSSQSLKERILMLKQPQPGTARRRTGTLALGVVLAGCSYAAWAVRPAAAPEPPPPPPTPPTVTAPLAPLAPPAPPAPPAPAQLAEPPAPPAPPPGPGQVPALPAPPAPPAMPPPRYPAEAAAAHQSGRVLLKLLVGVDGRVKDVVVEQSDPPGMFDAVTIEAARTWVLAPALEDGRPVEGWVRVPVEFEAPAKGAISDGNRAANTWIRVDEGEDPKVREMSCNLLVLPGTKGETGPSHCGVSSVPSPHG